MSEQPKKEYKVGKGKPPIETRIKKGQVLNPKGRPKKFVNHIIAELNELGYHNIRKQEVADTYETLLALPQPELVRIGNDAEMPMIFRILAKAMLGNKGFEIIERMLDRTQGKPQQSVDVTSDGNELKVALVEFIGDEQQDKS